MVHFWPSFFTLPFSCSCCILLPPTPSLFPLPGRVSPLLYILTCLLLQHRPMTLNLDKCIEQLTKCELLSENTIKDLCQHMREMLIYESNVQHVKAPVTVVGDVHGYVVFLLVLSMPIHVHNNPIHLHTPTYFTYY